MFWNCVKFIRKTFEIRAFLYLTGYLKHPDKILFFLQTKYFRCLTTPSVTSLLKAYLYINWAQLGTAKTFRYHIAEMFEKYQWGPQSGFGIPWCQDVQGFLTKNMSARCRIPRSLKGSGVIEFGEPEVKKVVYLQYTWGVL